MTINPAAPAANQARQTPHSVVIEDRKRLTATGILSIVSYDSFTATLETPGGTLAIGGEGLTVSELSVQTGEVKINGSIEYVQYTAKRENRNPCLKGWCGKWLAESRWGSRCGICSTPPGWGFFCVWATAPHACCWVQAKRYALSATPLCWPWGRFCTAARP